MSFISAMMLLFLVMDPVGNIPMFVLSLKDVPPQRHRPVIIRELLIALAILVVFLFSGKAILDMLHVSQASLGIAGGIIIFLISIKMIFSGADKIFKDTSQGEPFIVPLAVPLVAGPSAMTMVILLMAGEPGKWPVWLASVLCAWFAASLVLLASNRISRLLGAKGLAAIEKLMGMLLTAVAVEMFINGVEQLIKNQAISP